MAEYISPFDFKKIFLEYFLGSTQLFMFAFIILISFISAKYSISNRIFALVLAISTLMFGVYLGNAVYAFTLFIIGFISFKTIGRIVT